MSDTNQLLNEAQLKLSDRIDFNEFECKNSPDNTTQHDDEQLTCKLVSSSDPTNAHSVQLEINTTKDQLNVLCKQLQEETNKDDIDDETLYSFFVKGFEVTTNLSDVLKAIMKPDQSFDTLFDELKEQTLTIEYREDAIFRVQYATRCSNANEGHDREIIALQFSPDGSRIATGSGDKTVRIWDTSMSTSFEPCEGHPGYITCLEWSPDGNLLMSGCRGFAIGFWSKNGEKFFTNSRYHSNWVSSLCWRPFHLEDEPKSIYSASGSKDGTVSIWSQESKTSIKKLYTQGKNNAITCIKWSGTDRVIVGSEDRYIYVWKFKDYTLVHKIQEHAHWVNSLSLNSHFVLRTGGFDPKYLLDDPGYSLESSTLEKQHSIAKKRFQKFQTNLGERMASCSDDRTICLWSLKGTKLTAEKSADSSNQPKKNKIQPISEEINLVRKMSGHQGTVIHVCFSPNGFYLASASFDKSIRIWNAITGVELAVLRSHVLPVYRTVWSPDSRYLLSGSADSTIKIWSDFNKKKKNDYVKKDLPGHADEVYAVDWSPSGSKAASGGKDKLLKFWE